MKKLNFVVVIDRFDYGSGGNNIMHKLAKYLHEMGENVYTFGSGEDNYNYKVLDIEGYDPKYSTLLDINESTKILTKLDPDTTVFIPWGSFPYTKWLNNYGKVARWVMYYDIDIDHSEHDLVFFQQSSYNTRNEPFDGIMNIFDIDHDFWVPSTDVKEYNSFLYRKAAWNIKNYRSRGLMKLNAFSRYVDNKPQMNIDYIAGVGLKINENIDDYMQELRSIYQKSDYFICFDDITGHSLMAALCGAKTIVIPGYLKNLDKNSYKEKFDFFKYGIAYGLEDLNHIELTKDKLRPHMIELKNKSFEDVRNFVNICYSRFTK